MTTQPLSYNVFKNVLEYLSLEKRTQIVRYCPSVQTAERIIPLHLDRLCLNSVWAQPEYDWFLKIDDLEFTVAVQNRYHYEVQTSLMVKKGGIVVFKKGFNEELGNLMKKIIDYYLADRNIKVRYMEIMNEPQVVFLLPEGLTIECKELRTHNRSKFAFVTPAISRQLREQQLANVQAIRPFLTDTPLEKMFIYEDESNDPLFQEELVRNAKYLEIRQEWSAPIVMDLAGLKCNHIHVDTWRGWYCFNKRHAVNMAKMWLETCPKLGTRFTWNVWEYDYVLDVMHKMIEDVGAVRGKILDNEGVENAVVRHYVTIPMRSGHELNVIGELHNKQNVQEAGWLLRMEVMEPRLSICE